MVAPYSDPKAIVEAGEAIYKELYQEKYEKDHLGRFVAINILTKRATLSDSASDALVKAKKDEPNGVFHLIRVGFPGAFQLSRYQSAATAQKSLIK